MAKDIHILLADDDEDDRFFFNMALKDFPVKLTAVEDGEKLMHFLLANVKALPDVLFLDLNMPRKNGSECLLEIKEHESLKKLPVIIYSTSMHHNIANALYDSGAHYYNRKTDLPELQRVLEFVISRLTENTFSRPSRDKFILKMPEAEISS